MSTMRFPKIRRVMFQWVVVGAGALAVPLTGCGGGKEPLPIAEMPIVAKAPASGATPALPPPVDFREPAVKLPDPVVIPEHEPVVVPEGYAARMKLGHMLVADGRIDEAIMVFDRAAEDEPHKAAPHIEIARAAIVSKKLGVARQHAEEAVDLEPESSGAWNTLGRVELLDGDKLAAVAAFESATEANEDNAWAWNNLGLVLGQLGRWDESVAALERATSGDKPEAYMWTNLAVAYERTDQEDLARAAYRQAAKRGSDAAKAALARLDAPKVDTTAKAPGGVPGEGGTELPVDKLPSPAPEPAPVTPVIP